MTKIISTSARMEGVKPQVEHAAFMEIPGSVAHEYGVGVIFYPSWSHIILCRERKSEIGRMALFALPSAAWEADLDLECWEIVQRLTPPDQKADEVM